MLLLMLIIDEKKRDKLEIVYDNYKRDMYTMAFYILKDSELAKDVVQDTMLKICTKLDIFTTKHNNKERSYILQTVKNICIDYYRKKKEYLHQDYEEIKDNILSQDIHLDEQMIRMDMAKEIEEYLKTLHPPYAEVIMLRYYHGLLTHEIANLLDIKEVNVRVRLSRALNALKSVIVERGVLDEYIG